eukprot:7359990-Pyramimonas_sp.AAC.1
MVQIHGVDRAHWRQRQGAVRRVGGQDIPQLHWGSVVREGWRAEGFKQHSAAGARLLHQSR